MVEDRLYFISGGKHNIFASNVSENSDFCFMPYLHSYQFRIIRPSLRGPLCGGLHFRDSDGKLILPVLYHIPPLNLALLQCHPHYFLSEPYLERINWFFFASD